jgi:hypothetical protein
LHIVACASALLRGRYLVRIGPEDGVLSYALKKSAAVEHKEN